MLHGNGSFISYSWHILFLQPTTIPGATWSTNRNSFTEPCSGVCRPRRRSRCVPTSFRNHKFLTASNNGHLSVCLASPDMVSCVGGWLVRWLKYTSMQLRLNLTGVGSRCCSSLTRVVILFPFSSKTINANFCYFPSKNYWQFHPTYVIYYHYPMCHRR